MKHQFKHRVIYQDTDAEGVVYYANYLGFFERGRTELLRQAGISLNELKEKEGILFAVIRVECDYRSPALYDDEVTVRTEIESSSGVRMTFMQEVLRAGDILVSAKITVCSLGAKDFKPVKLPKALSGRFS